MSNYDWRVAVAALRDNCVPGKQKFTDTAPGMQHVLDVLEAAMEMMERILERG